MLCLVRSIYGDMGKKMTGSVQAKAESDITFQGQNLGRHKRREGNGRCETFLAQKSK